METWLDKYQNGGPIEEGKDFVKTWMASPITRKRYRENMSGQPVTDKTDLSIDNNIFQSGLENLWETTSKVKGKVPGTHGEYNNGNINFYGQPSVGTAIHEYTHSTGDLSNNLSKYLMQESGPLSSIRDKHGLDTVGSVKKEFGQLNAQNRIDHASYMGQNGELYPRIMEMRQFLGVKPGQQIDDDMVKRLMENKKTGETARYYTPKKLKNILNTVADNSSINNFSKIAQNGGTIKDDRGQWDHPGEITEIGSNKITMRGVSYPVLGISDTGDRQMMYPGQDYSYEGSKVTEYPMAQKGKTVKPRKKVVVFAEAPSDERSTYELESKNLPPNLSAIKKELNKVREEQENLVKMRDNSPYKKAISGHQKRIMDELSQLANKKDRTKEDDVKFNELSETYDSLLNNSGDEYNQNWSHKYRTLFEKDYSLQEAFYNPLLNPTVYTPRDTFIKEANNVKEFYKRQGNNVDVDVVPMYEQQQLLQDKLAGLNEGDDAVMFGHHGDKLAGIPNDTIAKYMGKSKASNCYLGACGAEDIIEPYKKMKGKNLNYRPNTPWLGFNPNAKTFDEGMWSRNYTEVSPYDQVNTEEEGYVPVLTASPKITPLKKGVTHKKIQLEKGGELQKLDQLTNFTNYGKGIKGGWLEKYSK